VGGFETFQDIGAYIWDGNAARMLPMRVATSVNAHGVVAGATVVGSVIPDGTSYRIFAKHAAIWLGGAEAQDLNLITDKGKPSCWKR
jgi:hypothetical protein